MRFCQPHINSQPSSQQPRWQRQEPSALWLEEEVAAAGNTSWRDALAKSRRQAPWELAAQSSMPNQPLWLPTPGWATLGNLGEDPGEGLGLGGTSVGGII